MNRTKFTDLKKWRVKRSRKPLIIQGARQVGKSFLVRAFAKEFQLFHEFNFQKSPQLHQIFKETKDPKKIIQSLEIFSEKKINLENDLIFFDEIQDCADALNSLKFFCEDTPGIFLIAAGSLLGIHLNQGSFPVGKVEFLELYPMTFKEYLEAKNKKMLLEDLNAFNERKNFSAGVHELLLEELRQYYLVGGMPESILTLLETNDLNKVRAKQEELLKTYKADFSKYSGAANALQLLTVFENIPRQLAKDNRKFHFNFLKPGSRYSMFRTSIDWLTSVGLAIKIPIIHHTEIPLKMHVEENQFKLYFFDVGLLAALAELPLNSFLVQSDFFKTFKGAFVENFFVQEFIASNMKSLYCWQGKASEVDFLYEKDALLCPIEVKSGESGKLKSLHFFSEKYPVKIKTRVSIKPFELNESARFQNIPLYLSSEVFGI